jgi:predicted  nucleic acid-binding Zn-ribbon protein
MVVDRLRTERDILAHQNQGLTDSLEALHEHHEARQEQQRRQQELMARKEVLRQELHVGAGDNSRKARSGRQALKSGIDKLVQDLTGHT